MGANSILYIDKTLTNGNIVISEVATTRPTLTSGAKIYMPENLSDGQTLVLFDEEADNSLADDALVTSPKLKTDLQKELRYFLHFKKLLFLPP